MIINVRLEFAAKTDKGLIRAQNEDAIDINPDYGFAILADGMGGYNAGEVASRMATETISHLLERKIMSEAAPERRPGSSKKIQQWVQSAITEANLAIIEAAQIEPQYYGMGTTIVVAVFHRDRVTIAHVGDSRAYRWRQGELVQITKDHSLIQEHIDAGLLTPQQARFSDRRNLVTRAVGVAHDMEVDTRDHQAKINDVYLLCSDGLSDMLTDEEISDILAATSDVHQACDTLIDQANARGGHDNISVILIRLQSTMPDASGLFSRLFKWVQQ